MQRTLGSPENHVIIRCALWSILLAAAVSARAAQLAIKRYTTADGLARDRVHCIVQDSRGYMWICTAEGLSRFDGYHFTNYTTTQGLAGNSVSDFLEARDGSYWIASRGGVCRFRPAAGPDSRFVRYRLGGTRNGEAANVLLEDQAGAIWCGTYAGLFRIAPHQPAFELVDIGLPGQEGDGTIISSLHQDRNGELWIGTGGGLYRRHPDGRTEHFTKSDGLMGGFINALLEDHQGRFWAGGTEGLCRLNPDPARGQRLVERVYTAGDGMATSWVNALLETSDHKLWVGTTALQEFNAEAAPPGRRFQTYRAATGRTTGANVLTEDRDGNLWIGTVNGLIKMARVGFTTYDEGDGLRAVAALFESRKGELLAVSRRDGGKVLLGKFDGSRFVPILPAFPPNIRDFGWGVDQIALQDHLGQWWLATGEGLCRFPRTSMAEQLARTPPRKIYTSRDGLPGSNIWRVFEAATGDIWISTISPSGLARWTRRTESLQAWPKSDPVMAFGSPSAFANDAAGNLWMGFFNGGLARYRDGRFTLFGESEGVPGGMVNSMHADRLGRLWVGIRRGLLRVDEPAAARPHFLHWDTADGLSSNAVQGIAEDGLGRIYVGTGRGVDRLGSAGTPELGHIWHYTTGDGLAGNDIAGAFGDRHGAVWFRAVDRLSRLVPQTQPVRPPPPVRITGLHVGGVPYRLSDLGETAVPGLALRAGQNNILVDFVGLSFAPGEALRYQYMLEGADRDWTPAADQRSVTYANLSPGGYRFLVRAINSDGAATPQPAMLAFRIQPPFWRSWWFELLAALCAAAGVYAFHRNRVARLLELERIRMRIATDLHDDIGASLSQIAVLSEVARVELARGDHRAEQPLVRIAGVSRELVDSMSEIVWAVNPQKDRLRDLAQHMREFADDVFVAHDIKFHFEAACSAQDVKLDMDARRQIFLIFKECVHNIARHSGCQRVQAELRVEGEWLLLRISDDGKGFDLARGTGAAANHGHGLESIERRARSLGGRLELHAAVGQGVTVSLRVPLSHRLAARLHPPKLAG